MITIGKLIPRMREFSDAERPSRRLSESRVGCSVRTIYENGISAHFAAAEKKETHLERLLGILMAKNGGGYLRRVSEERGGTQKNIPAAR